MCPKLSFIYYLNLNRYHRNNNVYEQLWSHFPDIPEQGFRNIF